MLSDKLRSIRKIILLALAVGALLFAAVPLFSRVTVLGINALFLVIPVTMFFRQPVMPLIDNWSIRNAAASGLSFGPIRAFGALSFALLAFGLGYAAPRMDLAHLFYISLAVTVPALALVAFSRGTQDGHDTGRKPLTFKEMQFGALFKNYYLVTYIIFTVFQRIPFTSSMVFLPFLIEAVGGDIGQLGIILGVRAATEIPVMFLFKKLQKRFALPILIMVSTGIFAAEVILYGFVTHFGMIVAISVLHGAANGLMIPAGSTYVYSLAPEKLKATSQTVLASMTAIAGILSGVLGGWLIMRVGITEFYLMMGVLSAVCLGLFAVSIAVGRRVVLQVENVES